MLGYPKLSLRTVIEHYNKHIHCCHLKVTQLSIQTPHELWFMHKSSYPQQPKKYPLSRVPKSNNPYTCSHNPIDPMTKFPSLCQNRQEQNDTKYQSRRSCHINESIERQTHQINWRERKKTGKWEGLEREQGRAACVPERIEEIGGSIKTQRPEISALERNWRYGWGRSEDV